MALEAQKGIWLGNFVRDVDYYDTTKKVPTTNNKFLSSHTWSEDDFFVLCFERLAKEFGIKKPASFEEANKLCIDCLYGLHRGHRSDVEAFFKVYRFEVPKLEVLPAEPLIVKPLLSLTANVDELDIMDGDGFTVYQVAKLSKDIPRWVTKHLEKLNAGITTDALRFSGRKTEKTNDYESRLCKDTGEFILYQRFPIRLRGIDAPEANQPYGLESRDILRSFLRGQRVQIVSYDLCPHKRFLADVYVNNKLVQEMLLTEAAVWYLEGSQEESWMKIDTLNRMKKKGMWGPPGARKDYAPIHRGKWRQLTPQERRDIWNQAPRSLRRPADED